MSKSWEKNEKFKNTKNLVVNIHPKLMKIKNILHKNIKIDGKKMLFDMWWMIDHIMTISKFIIPFPNFGYSTHP